MSHWTSRQNPFFAFFNVNYVHIHDGQVDEKKENLVPPLVQVSLTIV